MYKMANLEIYQNVKHATFQTDPKLFPNFSETAKPMVLKFCGKMSINLRIVLGFKKIWIHPSFARKREKMGSMVLYTAFPV